jgi:hypothetical protein
MYSIYWKHFQNQNDIHSYYRYYILTAKNSADIVNPTFSNSNLLTIYNSIHNNLPYKQNNAITDNSFCDYAHNLSVGNCPTLIGLTDLIINSQRATLDTDNRCVFTDYANQNQQLLSQLDQSSDILIFLQLNDYRFALNNVSSNLKSVITGQLITLLSDFMNTMQQFIDTINGLSNLAYYGSCAQCGNTGNNSSLETIRNCIIDSNNLINQSILMIQNILDFGPIYSK